MSTEKSPLVSTPPKKWDARYQGAVPHNNSYYAKCMFAGILSCGITHTGICPLDVVKCNMQVNPQKFTGLFSGMSMLIKEEGGMAIWKGWAPTAIGYSMQGLCKFGFYEVFKDLYSNLAGEENSVKYRKVIWLVGSASAEFFADIALCPMEMVKVKVQTSPAGTWPTSLVPATAEMFKQRANTRWPFGSLVPLWSRQIPYTMAKFFFFEQIVEGFYTCIYTKPKSSYGKRMQLGFTFMSGYLVGTICTIISHPADSMVPLLGKESNGGKSMGGIALDFGYTNLPLKV
eukprot:610190_1